jgi:hypothetical protein
MVQAPSRPASQVVELSKPAHFKGIVSPDYSNLKMIQAFPRPASQEVESSKPAHFKGTFLPDY